MSSFTSAIANSVQVLSWRQPAENTYDCSGCGSHVDCLYYITCRSIVKFVGLGFRTDRSGSNTDAVSADSMFIIQV